MVKTIDGVDGGGQRAVNFATPSSSSDLATKAYVDGAGGFPARASANATTASLAPNATDSSTTVTLATTFRLLSVQTSRPARVRLYTTSAAKTADLSRQPGADPASDAGVILEYISPDAAAHSLSPTIVGASMESTPSATISMAVTNNDSSTGTVTVTLIWERVE